jgi:hypothetical protein
LVRLYQARFIKWLEPVRRLDDCLPVTGMAEPSVDDETLGPHPVVSLVKVVNGQTHPDLTTGLAMHGIDRYLTGGRTTAACSWSPTLPFACCELCDPPCTCQ